MATAHSIDHDSAHELDAPSDGELRAIWGAATASLLFIVVAEVCLHLQVFNATL